MNIFIHIKKLISTYTYTHSTPHREYPNPPPTGFQALLPFFYPVYFAVLLVHRSLRDDGHCRHKYGKDWDTYCALVPYRIVPYVF